MFRWFVFPTCHCIYNVLAERLDKSDDPVCCTLAAVRVSSEETNKDTLRLIWYGTTIHIRQVVWPRSVSHVLFDS